MFLFFHDIGISAGALVLIFLIGVTPLLLIFLRAMWIIVFVKSKRAIIYGGYLFGISIFLWLLSWLSGSVIVEIFLMVLTLPFGMVLGILHGDFGFFIIRDAILGSLNAAHHPVRPHIYLYEAFLNALAVINAVQIIERIIEKRKQKFQ